MKRDVANRLTAARASMQLIYDDSDTDNDISFPNRRGRGTNKNNDSSNPAGEQTNIFNKFNDPLKFWEYQKSQEEN